MEHIGALLGRTTAPLGHLAPAETVLGAGAGQMVPRSSRRPPEVPGVPGGGGPEASKSPRKLGGLQKRRAGGGAQFSKLGAPPAQFTKHVFGFSKLGFVLDSSQPANLVNCPLCLENYFLNSAVVPPPSTGPTAWTPPGASGGLGRPPGPSGDPWGPLGASADLGGPSARR